MFNIKGLRLPWILTAIFSVVVSVGGFHLIQKENVIKMDIPVTTLQEDIVFTNDQLNVVSNVGIGIVEPKEVGLEYPQPVIDQGSFIGYALLGVDVETMDYIPLKMDVDGYIMCKDVNKEIFKLVPKE